MCVVTQMPKDHNAYPQKGNIDQQMNKIKLKTPTLKKQRSMSCLIKKKCFKTVLNELKEI